MHGNTVYTFQNEQTLCAWSTTIARVLYYSYNQVNLEDAEKKQQKKKLQFKKNSNMKCSRYFHNQYALDLRFIFY